MNKKRKKETLNDYEDDRLINWYTITSIIAYSNNKYVVNIKTPTNKHVCAKKNTGFFGTIQWKNVFFIDKKKVHLKIDSFE